jgi:polyphenol oxidase
VPAGLRQIHSAAVYQALHAGHSLSGAAPHKNELEYRPAGWPMPRWAPVRQANPLAGAILAPDPLSPEHGSSPAGDALVTAEPGILLSVRTADCLPVLLVDKKLCVIAAVHAGWRGALARLVEKTVGEMRRIFGSAPEDLAASMGPAIGRCCYEVGDEVVDAFRAQFIGCDNFFYRPPRGPSADHSPSRHSLLFYTQAPPGHRRERASLHLDLAAVAHTQLAAAGLKPSAIHNSGYCTACRPDLFFSYRREGARAGRMMAAIGIRR